MTVLYPVSGKPVAVGGAYKGNSVISAVQIWAFLVVLIIKGRVWARGNERRRTQ